MLSSASVRSALRRQLCSTGSNWKIVTETAERHSASILEIFVLQGAHGRLAHPRSAHLRVLQAFAHLRSLGVTRAIDVRELDQQTLSTEEYMLVRVLARLGCGADERWVLRCSCCCRPTTSSLCSKICPFPHGERRHLPGMLMRSVRIQAHQMGHQFDRRLSPQPSTIHDAVPCTATHAAPRLMAQPLFIAPA
jgi:hypothetical protein